MCLQYSNFSFCMQNIFFSPLFSAFCLLALVCLPLVGRVTTAHTQTPALGAGTKYCDLLASNGYTIWIGVYFVHRLQMDSIRAWKRFEVTSRFKRKKKLLCEKYAKMCDTHIVVVSDVHRNLHENSKLDKFGIAGDSYSVNGSNTATTLKFWMAGDALLSEKSDYP